ncbi:MULTISPECIES: FGGY family carbohydrate kinase [Microbacterium]|uniref:FGGY family carbohydrate kinase n=1 Tax=Microbacterium TaxID=33882 RepID=UPI000D6569CA|nr:MULTISPECIES: FGGY family carbohydrate kinase [Microbacterium]
MTTVLAIDQGTSGTKAVVVGADGAILGLAEVPLRPRYLPGGGVEQDPEELWTSVLAAGSSAIKQSRALIDVVTLANQGESVLAWDPASGKPLSNVVVWQDRRSQDICERLRPHAELISSRTGLVLDPYFSAPKQAWLRENVTHDGVVTTTDSWLIYRLTGEFVTDVTTASRSLLTDLDDIDWDLELIELFGLTDEKRPALLTSGAIAGTTAAFGGVMGVGGLIVDQQAALIAESCLDVGEAKCTFGTGAFLLANTGHVAHRSSAGLASSVAWHLDGRPTYCFDGQVYTVASAVRWMQNLGFIKHAAELDSVAADDADGVLSVPALAGLAAPWWEPQTKASFTGMTLSTGPEHLVLAVLQGIAAQVARLGQAVRDDLGSPLRRLRVDGGLTRSAVLMQSVADLMQIPVDVYPSPHATPLGAAALARVAIEPTVALADAVIPWQPSMTYEPLWSSDEAAEFQTRWNRVADAALQGEAV